METHWLARNGVNKDIIVRFEHLLNEYFEGDAPQNQGLPSVKYFADKVFLSANYFGDMVRKQTGKTVSEYIQDKMIELAKEQLMSSNKTMSQIAYEIGFQYPQHLSRMFKRIVGMTPNQFRLTGYCRWFHFVTFPANQHHPQQNHQQTGKLNEGNLLISKRYS